MSKVDSRAGSYWPYILFAYCCLLSLGFLDNTRGAVFENFIQSLSLSDSVAAWFFVVPSTFAFLSSLYCRRWIEVLGPISTLRVGLLIMTAAILSFAWTSNFLIILVEGAVFGIGFGVVSVAQNVAIGAAGDPQLRRQLFSGLHSMYGLASLLAPLVAGYLFALDYDWQGIFLFSVVVPMTVLTGGFLYRFRPWADIQRRTRNEEDQTQELSTDVKRHQLFLAAALSVYLVAEISISSRLVLLVQRSLQLPAERATTYLVAFFFLLFFSRMTFAFIRMPGLSTRVLIQGCLWGSTLLTVLGLILSPWFLVASGLTMAPFFPAAMDFLAEKFGRQAHGAMAYAMAFASLTVVGMHFLVGVLTDFWGIEKALWVAPISLVMTSGLLVIENKKYR